MTITRTKRNNVEFDPRITDDLHPNKLIELKIITHEHSPDLYERVMQYSKPKFNTSQYDIKYPQTLVEEQKASTSPSTLLNVLKQRNEEAKKFLERAEIESIKNEKRKTY